MTQYLFSYGTLQREDVQLSLFSRLLTGTKDILRGYKTATIEIADESFLALGEENQQLTSVWTGDEADAIEGMVFELSDEELAQADKYEPDGYERTKVELTSGKIAWIYVAGPNEL